MKKALALILALVLTLSLAACGGGASSSSAAAAPASEAAASEAVPAGEAASEAGSEAAASGSGYSIAFIVKGLDSQFFVDLQEGAEAAADKLGVSLSYLAPKGGQTDIAGEVQIMEDMIIQGVDAIIIDPSDDSALNSTIVKANEAGIPVILFNDMVDEADLEAQGGEFAAYIGLDSYTAAGLVGEYAASYSEPGKVAILEGYAGTAASMDRVNGFQDALPEGFEVVASQPANWDMNEAYSAMQNILTANPDVSVVWAVSCTMAMGAIKAIEEAGKMDQIDVYDFDCEVDDINAIKEGTLVATLRYPTGPWGELGVQTAVDILDGKDVATEVYTEVELITAENVDSIS